MEANIGLEPITQGYEPCVLPITPIRYIIAHYLQIQVGLEPTTSALSALL